GDMADSKQPSDGENLNELLSQLKGIFGHLSESDKTTPKPQAAPPTEPAKPAPPASEPPPVTPPPMAAEPPPVQAPEPTVAPVPLEEFIPATAENPTPPPVPSMEEAAALADIPMPGGDGNYTPNQVSVPEGAALIPSAIFYPIGRINEAKIVAEKVERITPK